MKRIMIALLLGGIHMLMSFNAHALAIVLESPFGGVLKIHPGEIMRVDVNVTGLRSPVPDTDVPAGVSLAQGPFRVDSFIAAFGVDVTFDPNVLQFTNAGSSPGAALGSPSLGESFFDLDFPAPGTIRLLGVSLLEESASGCVLCLAPYLSDLQSDNTGRLDKLTLATLAFSLAGIPSAADTATFLQPSDIVLANPGGEEIPLLDRDGNAVQNTSGQRITATDDLITGFVRAEVARVAVPEPDLLLLLGIGAAGWLAIGRVRRAAWRIHEQASRLDALSSAAM